MLFHHARTVTMAILIVGTAAGCASQSVKPAYSSSSTASTPVQNPATGVSPELLRMSRDLGYRPMRLFCRGAYPYQEGAAWACLYHGGRGYRPFLLYCQIGVPTGTALSHNNCVDEDDLRWQWQKLH